IPYAITLPATQLGHTIHFGHGRPRFVASRTTILPGRTCASLPSVGRRTNKKPRRQGGACGAGGTGLGEKSSFRGRSLQGIGGGSTATDVASVACHLTTTDMES